MSLYDLNVLGTCGAQIWDPNVASPEALDFLLKLEVLPDFACLVDVGSSVS